MNTHPQERSGRDSEPRGERFPPDLRIRLGRDFQHVYRCRKSVADDTLIVYAAWNGLGYPRLGLSVSGKVGGAVVRNRWKRLIREAFRRQREQLPSGIDLVVLPRRGATPDARRVFHSLPALARRAARKLQRDVPKK